MEEAGGEPSRMPGICCRSGETRGAPRGDGGGRLAAGGFVPAALRAAILAAMGGGTLTLQVLFFRETMSVFWGSEMVAGAVLGGWLLLGGIGGAVAWPAALSKLPVRAAFPGGLIALALVGPATIPLIRAIPSVAGHDPGVLLSFRTGAALTLLAMAPAGILSGAVFAAAISWTAGLPLRCSRHDPSPIEPGSYSSRCETGPDPSAREKGAVSAPGETGTEGQRRQNDATGTPAYGLPGRDQRGGYASDKNGGADVGGAAAAVYFWDNAGSVLGGLAVTAALCLGIPSNFQAAAVAGLFLAAAAGAAFLLYAGLRIRRATAAYGSRQFAARPESDMFRERQTRADAAETPPDVSSTQRNPGGGRTRLRRATVLEAAAFAALLNAAFAFTTFGTAIDEASLALAYPGETVIARGEAPSGQIVAAVRSGQVNFYRSGRFLASSESYAADEEMVHLAILHHKRPARVLLIGGLSRRWGTLAAMHGPEEITLLETDRVVASVLLGAGIASGLELEAMGGGDGESAAEAEAAAERGMGPPSLARDARPRISIRYDDPRAFLRRNPAAFDAAIFDVGMPATFSQHRLLTAEFFAEAAGALRPGGVLAFALPGRRGSQGRAERLILASVREALRSAFPETRLIAGEEAGFLFVASDSVLPGPEEMRLRWERRELRPATIRSEWIGSTYLGFADAHLAGALDSEKGFRRSSDFDPACVGYATAFMLKAAARWSSSFWTELLMDPVPHRVWFLFAAAAFGVAAMFAPDFLARLLRRSRAAACAGSPRSVPLAPASVGRIADAEEAPPSGSPTVKASDPPGASPAADISCAGAAVAASVSSGLYAPPIAWSIPAAFLGGAAGLVLEVVWMNGFQVVRGSLYGEIGAFLAAFMAGAGAGAILCVAAVGRLRLRAGSAGSEDAAAKWRKAGSSDPRDARRWMAAAGAGLAFIALMAAASGSMLELARAAGEYGGAGILAGANLAAGAAVGWLFAAASRAAAGSGEWGGAAWESGRRGAGRASAQAPEDCACDEDRWSGAAGGIVYGADLAGAAAGGYLCSGLMIPLLGMPMTGATVALACIPSAARLMYLSGAQMGKRKFAVVAGALAMIVLCALGLGRIAPFAAQNPQPFDRTSPAAARAADRMNAERTGSGAIGEKSDMEIQHENRLKAAKRMGRISRSLPIMGTMARVTVAVPEGDHVLTDRAFEAAFGAMKRVNELMSDYREDSEVARIRRMRPGESVALHEWTAEALGVSFLMHKYSGGAFDPTIRPALKLYRFTGREEALPDSESLAAAMAKVGLRSIEFDANSRRIRLGDRPVDLDFGAVGKGYANDRAAMALAELGVPGALMAISGEILALGRKEDGSPWRVGIQHPRDKEAIVAEVEAQPGEAISTSGDYEKFFLHRGVRHPHVIDARTGRPVLNGPASVTVIYLPPEGSGPPMNRAGAVADALATSLLILGQKDGRNMLERIPGAEAIFLYADERGNIKAAASAGAMRRTKFAAGIRTEELTDARNN